MGIPEYWKDESELELCQKAYEAGNLAGLYDILQLCGRIGKPLPEWALKAITIFFGDFLTDSLDKKRGRHSKWKTQYRQDMVDHRRAEAVQDCSEHSVSWDDGGVYLAASEILSGTFAVGEKHAIEKSYKRYTKRSKQNPFRYYRSKFIKIEGDLDLIPVTKERIKIMKKVQRLRRVKIE